jgi:hypothetical protein
MATQKIDPPLDQIERLAQPLNSGERLFLDWLVANLTSDWEIYVQPYMNGLRPDFVLLSPRKGIAVYEIKDWNLSALTYYYKGSRPGGLELWASDGKNHFRVGRDPLQQVKSYKAEIFSLYCPRLSSKHGFGAITGGVVFPFSLTAECSALLRPQVESLGLDKYPKHNLVIGADLLAGDCSEATLRKVLPSMFRRTDEMNEEIAADLRHWLIEPLAPKEQRANPFVELDDKQKNLVSGRTEKTGYRKIRGPAGSGKTSVLCGRAARLLAEGKKVLVITFNITLINYIRDSIVCFTFGVESSRNQIRKQITTLNFHYFCKRVALATGNIANYDQLMRRDLDANATDTDHLLSKDLPNAARSWVQELQDEDKYDAILVDEGQDFYLAWWQVLRGAHRDGGEMMLCADRTQNIYGVDQTWTEGTLKGSGILAKWTELHRSYRMPPEVCREATRFVEEFLPSAENLRPIAASGRGNDTIDIFNSESGLLGRTACLNWIQIPSGEKPEQSCFDALIAMVTLSEKCSTPINYADVTVLVEDKHTGMQLRKMLSTSGIRVIDTFDEDERVERKKKLAFRKGDGRVKITTIHSYKGWETRALIVQVGVAKTERDYALFYAAITRLKMCPPESYLTVVCSAPELEHFGSGWNH